MSYNRSVLDAEAAAGRFTQQGRAGRCAWRRVAPAPAALGGEARWIVGRGDGALASDIKPEAQGRICVGAEVPWHARGAQAVLAAIEEGDKMLAAQGAL